MPKRKTNPDSKPLLDSFIPPAAVRDVAARALKWRETAGGKGGTAVGVARARDLSNGRPVSTQTLKRMRAYFLRHYVDQQASGFFKGQEGFPSKGRIAWDLWGGAEGFDWATGILVRLGEVSER